MGVEYSIGVVYGLRIDDSSYDTSDDEPHVPEGFDMAYAGDLIDGEDCAYVIFKKDADAYKEIYNSYDGFGDCSGALQLHEMVNATGEDELVKIAEKLSVPIDIGHFLILSVG